MLSTLEDAIERNGKIQITLKKVKKGQNFCKGNSSEENLAPQDGAVLALTDNGKGIPSNIQDKLFDPFFTTKSIGSGSGFGLYNTKVFIEDHNGLISFISEADKGTTFFLFIPLESEEKENKTDQIKKTKRATKAFIKTKENKN